MSVFRKCTHFPIVKSDMSKKKKALAAQRLIDDLLDDSNPKVSDVNFGVTSTVPTPADKDEKSKSVVLELEDFRSKSNLPPVPDFTKDLVRDLAGELEKTLNSVMPKDDYPSADDRTMKIPKPKFDSEDVKAKVDSRTATEIRLSSMTNANSKQFSAPPIPGMVAGSSDATLRQSESLRIAQNRILDLENELERIRRENEQLAAAGETLRRRADDLASKSENLVSTLLEKEKIYEEERKLMQAHLRGKDREASDQKQKLDELEQRLESNFKKIRVRERDLEHRLEIAKVEHVNLLSSKDKMILDLKRQVDQLTTEGEYSKAKSHEMYNQFKDKQDTVRRVVRALRIALSILEGEDDSSAPLKKAE